MTFQPTNGASDEVKPLAAAAVAAAGPGAAAAARSYTRAYTPDDGTARRAAAIGHTVYATPRLYIVLRHKHEPLIITKLKNYTPLMSP